jgi:hypothetical protein
VPNDAPNFQICFLTDKDGGRVARPFKGYHRVAIDRRTIETHNDTENDTAQSDIFTVTGENAMASVFKITGRKGKKLAHWYGKIAVSTDKRIRVKLFTDKTASERRLMELQREADQRASGVRTVAMDYAMVSVDQHAKDYLESLRLEKRDTGTLRIGEWTLDKLIEWGKWHRISDVTADSMRNILTGLDRQGLTPSYQNKFIMRAKAFVHWLQREGRINADPLANLKRVDERNGRRTRARRALTDAESSALLLNSPEDRREKYAWAILAGLRRSELKELRWGDLRLNAPRPFIQLRPEQIHICSI